MPLFVTSTATCAAAYWRRLWLLASRCFLDWHDAVSRWFVMFECSTVICCVENENNDDNSALAWSRRVSSSVSARRHDTLEQAIAG